MKKLAMILIALMLSFGLASGAVASSTGTAYDTDRDEKVTYKDGITTIVTTKKEVTHDKIVKTKKSTDFSTKKKQDKSTYEKVEVDVKKEKHPKHDWYREVKTETTYEFTKITTWDEVTKITTTRKTTTPVTITKTTVTTVKHKGKPGEGGKVISKKSNTKVDKKYGKAKVKVTKDKQVKKENEKTKIDKKVINVKVTHGKWQKKDKDDKNEKGDKQDKDDKH